jgi:hypothetical protein
MPEYDLADFLVSILMLMTVLGVVFLLVRSFTPSASVPEPEPEPTRQERTASREIRSGEKKEDRLVSGERQVGLTATRGEARRAETAEPDLVPVAAFSSPAEANVARDRLRAAGIVAVLVGETALRTERSTAPGVEVHVREADTEAALAILDELATEPVSGLVAESDVVVPREKAGDLVTVATFDSPVEAQLALAVLEQAGIRGILADDQLIAMDWALSNAVGGIKVQVLGVDAPAAVRALAEPREVSQEQAPSSEAIAATRSTEEDDPPGAREAMAERAAKGAMLGLLLWPVQFYVAWLLVQVFYSNQSLRPEYRRRAILAAIICIPLVAVMLVALLILSRAIVYLLFRPRRW